MDWHIFQALSHGIWFIISRQFQKHGQILFSSFCLHKIFSLLIEYYLLNWCTTYIYRMNSSFAIILCIIVKRCLSGLYRICLVLLINVCLMHHSIVYTLQRQTPISTPSNTKKINKNKQNILTYCAKWIMFTSICI